MDAFEYLSVLISIVLGLAVTQLLSGVGKLVKARGRVSFFAPSAIWMATLLLAIVQSWWAMFSLRAVDDWTFVGFAVVLLHPMLLYLLVELCLPELEPTGPVDMKANYFRQSRLFFVAATLLIISSLVRPLVLYGGLSEPADVGVQLIFLGLAGAALFWRNPRFHWLLAPAVALFQIAYIAILFVQLR